MRHKFLTKIWLLFLLVGLVGCLEMEYQAPAPVTKYGHSSGSGSLGVHNVEAGDRLYEVAQRYRLPMRDIVTINHLKAPFKLREGQRLLLPPPQDYTTRAGDTLQSVSNLFGVSANELARLNDIEPPYRLAAGQVLRLPFATRKKKQNEAVIVQSGVEESTKPTAIQKEILSPQNKVDNQVTIRPPAIPSQKKKMQQKQKHPDTQQETPKVIKKELPSETDKFLRPVSGKIISSFGVKSGGLHNDGINIAAPKGTPVKAAQSGVVVYAGNELKGSGNLILIRHEDQWITAYAHLDKMDVQKGVVVERGQSIGSVGASGSVSTPQLHFELRRGTEAINPKKYLE